VKFSFIYAEKAKFPVAALCRVLEVTRQGNYAFAKRPASARATSDAILRERVRTEPLRELWDRRVLTHGGEGDLCLELGRVLRTGVLLHRCSSSAGAGSPVPP